MAACCKSQYKIRCIYSSADRSSILSDLCSSDLTVPALGETEETTRNFHLEVTLVPRNLNQDSTNSELV